jgi:hypothetical protein
VGGDEGILDNSNSKFLFSIDGNKEEFKKRLKLSSKAIETIESLEKINGKLSEVFLSDGFSEKVLGFGLSPQEYWSDYFQSQRHYKIEPFVKSSARLN